MRLRHGLDAPADVRLDVEPVIWRLGRLSSEHDRKSVKRELELAQAQVEIGLVDDGFARLNELIEAIHDWAFFTDKPLEIPKAPNRSAREDTPADSGSS
jgi:hypothetical protein